MTKILHRRGAGKPEPSIIDVGEILMDVVNGVLFIKQSDDTVVEIGGGSGLRDSNTNVDGGSASSVYLLDQIIDGGTA